MYDIHRIDTCWQQRRPSQVNNNDQEFKKEFEVKFELCMSDQVTVLLGGTSVSIRRTTEVHLQQYSDLDFESRGDLVDATLFRKHHGDPKKFKLKTMHGWIDGKWKLGVAIPTNGPGVSEYVFRKGNRTLKDKMARSHV